MKKLFLVLALFSTTIFFTSCEKDSILEKEAVDQNSSTKRMNVICGPATNIKTTVNGTAVEINFDVTQNVILSRVLFKKTGAANFTGFSTYTNVASISRLEKNTEYELMIRTPCGEIGTKDSKIVKFTTGSTEVNCAKVLGLKNETPTKNSVRIKFGAVHGSSQYLIFYKKEGDKLAKSASSRFPLATLTNLEPGSKYEIKVRALCSELGAMYSTPITVTTASVNDTATGCEAPTNVTASVNGTAITILFDASSSERATLYAIRYRKVGSTAFFSGFSTRANGGSISALEPNTEYEIRVRTLCGEIGSTWSPSVKVTTGASTSQCGNVVRLKVSNIEETTAKLTFGTVTGRSQYLVFFKKAGAKSYRSTTSFFTSPTLRDLEPGTEYQATIKSKCGEVEGANSNVVTFKTKGTRTACNGLKVGLKLTLDGYGSETSFVLKKNGTQINAGGTFQDGASGRVVKKTFNLQNGNYELMVKDTYGDGICCDYGNGSFDLIDASGNVIRTFDGNFGTEKKVSFAIQNCQMGAISVQKNAKRRMRGKKK